MRRLILWGLCALSCVSDHYALYGAWDASDRPSPDRPDASMDAPRDTGTMTDIPRDSSEAEVAPADTPAPVCDAGVPDSGAQWCNGTCRDTRTDPNHCGVCGMACGTNRLCCGGVCVASDINNCGSCGNNCMRLPNAMGMCRDGGCVVTGCLSGYGNCDNLASNGCEVDLQTTLTDCGSCGAGCAPVNASGPRCANGQCQFTACQVNFASCDSNNANGCEVNTLSDSTNCGACGRGCPSMNGTSNCDAGVCHNNCNPGYADCDYGAVGCETDTRINVDNCGSCGMRCGSFGHRMVSCSSGVCVPGNCAVGYDNCDNNMATECETDVRVTNEHCGMCNRRCMNGICTNGTCNCSNGYADCDFSRNNGCETTLPNALCVRCSTTPCTARSHADAACTAGICRYSCQSGWGDCDGNISNGCEANLNTNNGHCGGCNIVCESVCNAGSCT